MPATERFFPNWLILLHKPALGCYGIVQLNPKCPKVLGEERAQRQCIRGYQVYVMIWKPLVGEGLQFVKETANKAGKIAVAVVFSNSHCKEVVGHVYHKSP